MELKQYLLRYHQQAPAGEFHGIVFARTREAVRGLTKLIGASQELQFMNVGCRPGSLLSGEC